MEVEIKETLPADSLPVSERSERNDPPASSLETQLALLKDNQELLFRRVDQLARLMEGSLVDLNKSNQAMQTAIQLWEQLLGKLDETCERLGDVTAAQVRLYEADQAKQTNQ